MIKSKKGGIIGSILGDIVLFVAGFIGGYFYGDNIIAMVRGWLHI